MLQLGYTTVGYLKMQMVVAHGGRCAERILNGPDITDGGQDDLVKISKVVDCVRVSFLYLFSIMPVNAIFSYICHLSSALISILLFRLRESWR